MFKFIKYFSRTKLRVQKSTCKTDFWCNAMCVRHILYHFKKQGALTQSMRHFIKIKFTYAKVFSFISV